MRPHHIRLLPFLPAVPKDKHKWVIGPKGANLSSIFQKTGVMVSMPAMDDESHVITLRGNGAGLSTYVLLFVLKLLYHRLRPGVLCSLCLWVSLVARVDTGWPRVCFAI